MPQSGREVVIVEAVRTPIGRGHREKGYYKDVHANALLAKAYTEVIERAGIDPSEVEDVVAGCVQQLGEQGFNIARNAWLQAGLPVETPATTVDRQCGSAQQAVNFAAALVASGVHDVVIGAGVEHMGHVPLRHGMKWAEEVGHRLSRPSSWSAIDLVRAGPGRGAHRRPWEIPRSELDELALRSHRLAARGDRGGPLRARDHPVAGERRHLRHRPGHPAGHDARGARAAQAGVQGGRHDHGRQLVADLRRRGRGAADDAARRRTRSG